MNYRKTSLLVFVCLLALLLNISQPVYFTVNKYQNITPKELEIISRINGTNIYNYDLKLEEIAKNHHAYRSGGSLGANETANWIKEQFESFGLETHLESFNFTTWDILSQPTLVIDIDGNMNTTDDQTTIKSFQPEHFSWPTPENGVFSDLVILPLPEAGTFYALGKRPYDAIVWNSINTTGKILLIGKEVRWATSTWNVFRNKLKTQPPLAVIFTWWYDWMNFTPPTLSSTGGRPAGAYGPFYWDLNITVGCITYEDGLYIRGIEESMNVSALVSVNAVIKCGPHYNVIGKLEGCINPDRYIIISSHYDTVTCCGFCDNGAGTAGVIELARVFSEAAKEGIYKPEQTLLFITFASEELGLVGSIHYVKQHEAEMKNIVAVINLDSIGSDILEVSETLKAGEIDLDELVLKAASDLNVKANLTSFGGSDQLSFQYPKEANKLYKYTFWYGLDAEIDDATPVISSTGLFSSPLFPNEKWYNSAPGWIHTQWDNSSTPNWVEIDDVEAHVRVAALSILRLLAPRVALLLPQFTIAAVVIFSALAIFAYFQQSRTRIFFTWIHRQMCNIASFMDLRNLVYVTILAALFLFTFSLASMHFEKVEIADDYGFPAMVTAVTWGVPLKMGAIMQAERTTPQMDDPTHYEPIVMYTSGGTLIFWEGVILDVILYMVLAFVITYLILKVKHELSLRAEA
jgi:hypothetical protein